MLVLESTVILSLLKLLIVSLSLSPQFRFYDLCTDVFLSLNDDVIPNHGYVVISDIGSNDNSALLCHTNRYYINGEWHGPNGSSINGFTETRRNRAVRLKRVGGTPTEGIYHCSIQDAAFISQTVFVGLYNNGRGNACWGFESSYCHNNLLHWLNCFIYTQVFSHCLVGWLSL